MKRNYILLFIVAVSIALNACQPGENAEAENKTTEEENKAYPVRTITTQLTKVERTEEYTASINAWEEVSIAPAQPNKINKILVEVGNKVRKGQTLVRMDNSALLQAKIQLEDARRDLARMDTLLSYGTTTQQNYDKAKMGYELAKTTVENLEQNVVLQAPFSGTITGKYFNDGEIYSGMSTRGTAAIVTLMQINPLKVTINVSESFWPVIKEGMPAMLMCDIYPGEQFTGKISKIYPTIDAATKTFAVELRVPNGNEKLRPGMFGKVALNFGEQKAMLIPVNAVLKQQGTNERYIFVNQNGTANKIMVEMGKRYDEKVEIVKGLENNMQLIVAGHTNLMDKDKVEVTK